MSFGLEKVEKDKAGSNCLERDAHAEGSSPLSLRIAGTYLWGGLPSKNSGCCAVPLRLCPEEGCPIWPPCRDLYQPLKQELPGCHSEPPRMHPKLPRILNQGMHPKPQVESLYDLSHTP